MEVCDRRRRRGCSQALRTSHMGVERLLLDKRQVTLILRLVLDAHGRLRHAEALDTQAKSQGRFIGWHSLTRTVREWLARQEHDNG